MGGFPDEKPPSYPSTAQATSSSTPFHSQFATLSFDATDHIRFLHFPKSDVQALQSVVAEVWPRGIKATGNYGASIDLKLHGYPFTRAGSTNEISSCILVRSILSHLFSNGWILHQRVGVMNTTLMMDSLIFRHQIPPPPPATWFAISFYAVDRLRIFGAEQEVIGALGLLLKSLERWQNEEWKDEKLEAFEYKLTGSPWYPTGEGIVKTRELIMRMLELLEQYGWSLYASVNRQGAAADFWYLVKMTDWVPGKPVFHR